MTPVSFGSEGEVKARRPDLEELEVRDDERVAGTPEEDPDEGDEEPEDGEQREQGDLVLRSDGRTASTLARSMNGISAAPTSTKVGTSTPATVGWKYASSSWRPRKYHG